MCLGINLQPNEQEDDIGIFYEVSTKNQDSLIAYCKKKSRQMHKVKSGEVNSCSTACKVTVLVQRGLMALSTVLFTKVLEDPKEGNGRVCKN